MFKITVLYKNPKNPSDFDTYYKEKHIPLVKQIEGLLKFELTKIHRVPGDSRSDHYLIAELYFRNEEQMQEAMSSPEGQATVDDLNHFATGGVTILIGSTLDNW